jgi:hypothetical protein
MTGARRSAPVSLNICKLRKIRAWRRVDRDNDFRSSDRLGIEFHLKTQKRQGWPSSQCSKSVRQDSGWT